MIQNYQELADKIDIIIPVYNGLEKLRKTIYSYGSEIKYHFIIVIDGDTIDYTPIKEFFQDIQDLTIIYLEENSGPGVARNYGISISKREYITFIDAGDTIYSPKVMRDIMEKIINEPQFSMISCAHYEMRNEDNTLRIIGPDHNRMHGKFFKRNFIEQYQIRFDPNTSRMNEDIGFNFIARNILAYLTEQDKQSRVLHLTDPLVVWECDDNSITRLNNYAFYYQKNNEGLSRNAIYAIKHLQKYNIPELYIYDIAYQTIPSLYLFYYSCVFCRPEFKQEMYDGAKLFFTFFKENNLKIDPNTLNEYYQRMLKGIYSSEWDPFIMGIPDMTIWQWMDKLFNIE